MAVFTVSLQQASGVGNVNIGDGTTLAELSVSAGRGPKGDGFTGGTYDDSTGKVTFTSNDGIGFETGDLRGDLTEPGPIGSVTPSTGAFTSLSTTGDAVVGGNLTVEGTTTTVDSTTVAVADKNIELAKDATTPAEADGGGITLIGASATITYSSANDYWALNKDLNVSGDVSLSGVVDGRDVASDGSKLDGIESGATADQTAGEIKTAYESNADTNAFTDSEKTKLSNIESNADVTDTANVTAAGALMDSELTDEAAVKALNQGVATTDSPEFAGLTVDTDTLYVDSANNRVGIGTSSPSEALEINGDVKATAFIGDGSQLTGLPSGYTDADVDAHLNQSTATADQVLTWDGSDYAWEDASTTVTQPTADWEAGTSTTEGIVSPAKVAASAEVNSPVKAWVNFDGTGTVSIRESFNVSSITDNGTGDYTVNFDTALVDANYIVSGHSIDASSTEPAYQFATTFDAGDQLAGSVRIRTGFVIDINRGFDDREDVQVSIIR